MDYETEKNIQEALDTRLKGKTLLISAHRLSTLRKTDKIIVIEHGRIVEEGSYDDLVKKKGEFYSLLSKQGGR